MNFDLEEQGNENNGLGKEGNEKSVIYYETPANVRKLTLVLLNGERYLFDYSDLSKVHFSPEKNELDIHFGNEKVTIKGEKISYLFDLFELNIIRKISCIDSRYNMIGLPNETVVTSIII